MIGSPITWNNAAAVAQTGTKSVLLPGGGYLWVNDTAKGSNIREEFGYTPKFWSQPLGTQLVPMVKSTTVWERQTSTDLLPARIVMMISMPKAALGVPATARYHVKDFNALWTALTNLDVEIDDIINGRAHL